MRKYFTVFGLSFQNEFTYRLNFVLWRFRNVLRILMTYFLWNSIFSQNSVAFGYSREQMFSYVFLVLIVSSFVFAAPSNDNIGSEISNGDLSNYLLKPVGYLRYWLTRDWASKLLNMLFASVEITLLWFLFKPTLVFSSSVVQIILGLLVVLSAALIFFNLTKLAVSVAFWNPEDTWGFMFLIYIFMETISGSVFPLDILPPPVFTVVHFTPFPYMIYYPIAILVGKLSVQATWHVLIQSCIWLIITTIVMGKVWKTGLKSYSASGR